MNYLNHVTLDEADTMLDDSFNEQVTHFMTKFPIQDGGESQHSEVLSGAQLTLVAATSPRDLTKILEPIVNPDSVVRVSTPHLNQLMRHVPQRFFRINKNTKVEKLMELVKNDSHRGSPVIIFSNKIKTSDWLSLLLNDNGVPCANLNGTVPSALRQKHYDALMSGEVKALSCTDLTSRGLDTCMVSHVINYDFPNYIADYIHRCGRTGRVGGANASLVTSLVHKPWEVDLVQRIEYAVRKREEFHNVNANIKRILTVRQQKKELKQVQA
ncbi:putative ATP-dependent RNA helicase DDX28 [Portunus trituberculatus]|uniref:Putative ATP-dependent RNA helicase DDX28 n=2 Tax=Portunus trituberculatus TaxID=210409 RepID=A0A5B7GIP0_PORTR|nr:putative ATP-dependent RNA helicase DDX28 [Portunus trituberculatus]